MNQATLEAAIVATQSRILNLKREIILSISKHAAFATLSDELRHQTSELDRLKADLKTLAIDVSVAPWRHDGRRAQR